MREPTIADVMKSPIHLLFKQRKTITLNETLWGLAYLGDMYNSYCSSQLANARNGSRINCENCKESPNASRMKGMERECAKHSSTSSEFQ
jgi:hypothetical protein